MAGEAIVVVAEIVTDDQYEVGLRRGYPGPEHEQYNPHSCHSIRA